MAATDPRPAMLSELSQCAYRLGLAFGQAAERAEDMAGKLEYFRLFDRCFFAMRVATALELRLRRAPAAWGEGPSGRDEDLDDRADPPESERPDSGADLERERPESDREEADRDREREAEPASLPVLLRTLDGVAADAAVLPGPEPAALPTLHGVLARAAPRTPAASSPQPKTDLRARLAGSGAAMPLPRAPRLKGTPFGPAARRATGPPRR